MIRRAHVLGELRRQENSEAMRSLDTKLGYRERFVSIAVRGPAGRLSGR